MSDNKNDKPLLAAVKKELLESHYSKIVSEKERLCVRSKKMRGAPKRRGASATTVTTRGPFNLFSFEGNLLNSFTIPSGGHMRVSTAPRHMTTYDIKVEIVLKTKKEKTNVLKRDLLLKILTQIYEATTKGDGSGDDSGEYLEIRDIYGVCLRLDLLTDDTVVSQDEIQDRFYVESSTGKGK